MATGLPNTNSSRLANVVKSYRVNWPLHCPRTTCCSPVKGPVSGRNLPSLFSVNQGIDEHALALSVQSRKIA